MFRIGIMKYYSSIKVIDKTTTESTKNIHFNKMDEEEKLKNVVLQAKIPAHIGRRDSVSTTMTVLLTNAGNIQYHSSIAGSTIPEQDDLYHMKTEESVLSKREPIYSNLSSRTASSNTLQVPYFEITLDSSRRRSLSSLHDHPMTSTTCLFHDRRRLSAPSTTRRSSWGPIWELRKQFLPHRRRQSTEDHHFFHYHQIQQVMK